MCIRLRVRNENRTSQGFVQLVPVNSTFHELSSTTEKSTKAKLLDYVPPSTVKMISDSSFINTDLLMHMLQHFKEHGSRSLSWIVCILLRNVLPSFHNSSVKYLFLYMYPFHYLSSFFNSVHICTISLFGIYFYLYFVYFEVRTNNCASSMNTNYLII